MKTIIKTIIISSLFTSSAVLSATEQKLPTQLNISYIPNQPEDAGFRATGVL